MRCVYNLPRHCMTVCIVCQRPVRFSPSLLAVAEAAAAIPVSLRGRVSDGRAEGSWTEDEQLLRTFACSGRRAVRLTLAMRSSHARASVLSQRAARVVIRPPARSFAAQSTVAGRASGAHCWRTRQRTVDCSWHGGERRKQHAALHDANANVDAIVSICACRPNLTRRYRVQEPLAAETMEWRERHYCGIRCAGRNRTGAETPN
jgi:hypothetical protein